MSGEEVDGIFSSFYRIIMERISKLKDMLGGSPNDCFLLHALGLEYTKLGDLQTARNYFEQVLQADPTYVGTYYHLAKLIAESGETERAVLVYERGMAQAKLLNDLHAYNELRSAWEELTF
jgi:tetratricopeptide (TPR) repeat protein